MQAWRTRRPKERWGEDEGCEWRAAHAHVPADPRIPTFIGLCPEEAYHPLHVPAHPLSSAQSSPLGFSLMRAWSHSLMAPPLQS